MDFEDFQQELSLEMNENIKQDLIKIKKEEDELLLNIKNEKNKQNDIKQKQIDDDNKQKELTIKASRDAEIKKNVDNALAIQKQQMTSDHNKQIQTIRTELDTLKKS